MYEQVSVQQMIDQISHIQDLYRRDSSAARDTNSDQKVRHEFMRKVVDNLRRQRSLLSPRTLGGLSQHANLTIGGAFHLVGYPLDKMRSLEFLLNGHRTRIIESYPFYRDREVDLPHVLAEGDVLKRSAFISEVVLRWQRRVPIRAVQGPTWRKEGIYYVQLGTEDVLRLTGLPPGAVLSMEPIDAEEQVNPDPKSIYCLQFKSGYRCSRYVISRGRLVLLPYNHAYSGPYEFLYPQDVRIVGKACGFAVRLSPVMHDAPQESRPCGSAPLILPWEQPSFTSLLDTERLRLSLTTQTLEHANNLLGAMIGTTISARTLRRYHRSTEMNPSTDVLVALALVHALRFSDALRLIGLWQHDTNRHSLKIWQEAATLGDLRMKTSRTAVIPEPHDSWENFRQEWGEWPTLLSLTLPNLEQFQHRLLRIHQNSYFNGLSPLIHQGTVALIEELDDLHDVLPGRENSEWDRPIYVLRHRQSLLSGYLDWDGERVALVPHPRSSAHRTSFLRHQVEIVGKWIGIASPLPHRLIDQPLKSHNP
jgi:hypothetical protein